MDWNYLLFTFLGFFIGIYVCLFYRLGVKPIFDAEEGCVGHVAPNKPIPSFTPPKPKSFTKVNVDRYGNEIDVGDTVWYQGEKWMVDVVQCLGSDDCRLHLINSSRNYWQWVGVYFVKKVVRTDSHTDHAT